MFFDDFAHKQMVPTNSKIILPQAEMRWNPIWGGCESNSWFTLIKNASLEPDVYREGIYAPFFN